MFGTIDEPLVSIVIPVYNAEDYLEGSIRSVLLQSYENLEIVCVDDGSADNSSVILQSLRKEDLRISVLHQENRGAGAARNLGMKAAKGEYILFFDADDVLKRNAVKTAVRGAVKHDADIVLYGYYKFTGCRKIHVDFSAKKLKVPMNRPAAPADISDRLFQCDHGMPWNKLYKTEFLRSTKVEFQELRNTNDEFFSRLTTVQAERIVFLDKILAGYRVGNKESLHGNSGENILDCTYALKAIHDELKKRGYYEIYEETYKKLAGYIIMLKLIAIDDRELFSFFAKEVYNNVIESCEMDEEFLEKQYRAAFCSLKLGDVAKAWEEICHLKQLQPDNGCNRGIHEIRRL